MQEPSAGSSKFGEPAFLAVGLLRRPHGVQGEIVMTVWTEFPERLKPGIEVYVGSDHLPVRIRSIRWKHEDLLISFDEFPTREDLGGMRNQILMVKTENLPALSDGELYLHQILGMMVIDDASDRNLGRITDVIETGANDVYILRDDDGVEFLIPAIDEVILDINLDANEMRVHLLPGLIPGLDD